MCRRWDSNPQVLRHMLLRHARIPIPPRRRNKTIVLVIHKKRETINNFVKKEGRDAKCVRPYRTVSPCWGSPSGLDVHPLKGGYLLLKGPDIGRHHGDVSRGRPE